jgi:hypothetical protein
MFISSKKGKFTKVGIESKYLFENIWRGELNDSFDMVRSQNLLMDPLPPLNKVFSMVIQHERQFVTSNSGLELEDSKVSVNASDSRRSQGRGKGGYNGQSNSGPKKRYCTYCGNDNHIVDNCSNVDDQSDIDDVRSTKGSDSYTLTKTRYEKLVNLLQSSASVQNASSSTQVNGASTSNMGNVAVMNHQGNTNVAYSYNHSSYGAWIIDSGASDHICSNVALFDDYHDITPIQVKMPNGTIAHAKQAGSVKLSDNFVVNNVLLVPEFSLNLLSVPRLTYNSQIVVHFDGLACLIQEKKSMKMIGSGELIEGLYYLTNQPKPVAANTNTQSTHNSNIHIAKQALWHFRL